MRSMQQARSLDERLFVLMTLAGGHGILVYLILTVIMPEEGAPVGKAHVFDEEEIIIKEA